MYDAIASAPLGDDVLGDDPTVQALEELAAGLFGKEAALFVPSGTMANQIAIRIHCRPGDELVAEETSHVVLYEQGGAAQLSGVATRTLRGRRGVLDLRDLERAIRPDDPHHPVTRLVTMENTHNNGGGAVVPLAHVREVRAIADRHGLAMHLDGARVCNASAASGLALDELAAPFDTVTCCLSKGLCAPMGSVLAGSRDAMRLARRVRKVFGGGMRQAGILAACGIVALRDMRARLGEDHERARRLAAGIADAVSASGAAIEVLVPETNLVYVTAPDRAEAVENALRARGVLAVTNDADTLRLATHHDVGDADVERAIAAFDAVR
jgi:threonine aldolase